jgi:acetyl-CoA carboxylase biotin carboxyl carrier protein
MAAASRKKKATRWTAREVVELAVQHDLAELEVEQAGLRVRVVRERAAAERPLARHAPVAISGAEGQPAALADPALSPELTTIEAPMVGTFYRASGPEAAPFVVEGDSVKEGQVLCIIEAMKLMNEIEAKVAGRVARILVENGQPVEYGQALFLVDPRR